MDDDLLLFTGPVTPPAAGYDRPTDVIGTLTAQCHAVRSITINTPGRCLVVLEIKLPAALVALAASGTEQPEETDGTRDVDGTIADHVDDAGHGTLGLMLVLIASISVDSGTNNDVGLGML